MAERAAVTEGTGRPAGADAPGRPSAPVPVDLVGRGELLAAVGAALADPAVRLLTLTGSGGVGKTAVARAQAATAETAAAYPDGVDIVGLADERDPDRLPLAVLQGLGLEPAPGEAPADTLARGLSGRRLLVLDNLEQLVAGAGAVGDLVAACPGLTVLATSRVRLGLPGERELAVPPLALPAPGDASVEAVGTSPAVQLLARRARRANAAFALSEGNAAAVAEIARRLDGLPLALELGAARLGVLSPEALLARLDARPDARLDLLTGGPRDADARHRSLRAAVAWSVELLGEAERRLFALLSVFAGGCYREDLEVVAAEVVAGDDAASAASVGVAPAVDGLAAASLLTETVDASGDPRLGMLESVREVAAELLAASGDEGRVRDAHAARYLAVAEREGPRLHLEVESYAQLRVWNRLEADIANLRAAADRYLARGEAAEGLRVVVGLDWFWSDAVYLREGVERVERLLVAAGGRDGVPRPVWLAAHRVLAMLHGHLGDEAAVGRAADEAARASAETDDPATRAEVLNLASQAAQGRGDLAAARRYGERCLAVTEASGQVWFSAYVHDRLGRLSLHDGDPTAAEAHAAAALAGYRGLGDLSRMPGPHLTLAGARMLEGDLAAAAGELLAALAAAEPALGEGPGYGGALQDIFGAAAVLAHRAGDAVGAAGFAGLAEAEARRTGMPGDGLAAPELADATAAARAALGGARFAAAWGAGSELAQPERVAQARTFLRGLVAPPLTGRLTELSPRELEVLRLVAAGRTNREVGEALFISPQTASTHVSNLLAKLGLPTRTAAAAYATAHGLTPSGFSPLPGERGRG